MPLNEKEKQFLFSRMVAALIQEAVARGFDVTFGEVYRSPEAAKIEAAKGKGIANSDHCERLAIDICLFKSGVYLTTTEAYRELGEWWERLSTSLATFCWGGRFTRADGNHFSIEHNGVR